MVCRSCKLKAGLQNSLDDDNECNQATRHQCWGKRYHAGIQRKQRCNQSMSKLLIVGAGGHGRVVADIARLSGKYDQIAFIDDADMQYSGGLQVIGKIADIDQWLNKCEIFVAIGDNQTRRYVMSTLENKDARISTLIHPAAVISSDVIIGVGSVVMANAVINSGSRIGKGVIVNTAASVDHDNEIHDYAHISPGAHLAGSVKISEDTWIGIGAIVSNNLSICKNCMIGAGAVVIKNITIPGTYVGVPAILSTKDLTT